MAHAHEHSAVNLDIVVAVLGLRTDPAAVEVAADR
jgi:hypothetical protein